MSPSIQSKLFQNVFQVSLVYKTAFLGTIGLQAASSRGAAEADFDTLNALQRVLSGFVAMREASKQGQIHPHILNHN